MRLAALPFLLLALSGCATNPPGPAASAPEYEVVSRADDQVIVEVASTDRLEAVFEDVKRSIDEDGGWFVTINCSTGATAGSDNRLANGRYAVGNIGAARTGLDEGESDFEAVSGRECPAP